MACIPLNYYTSIGYAEETSASLSVNYELRISNYLVILITSEKTVIEEENLHYQCKECGRQFIEFYSEVGYSPEIKENCLKMYVNGSGFRAIERITSLIADLFLT